MAVTFIVTRRPASEHFEGYDPTTDPRCTPTGSTARAWVGKTDPEADAEGYAEVPTYLRTTYAGAVLETREFNGHDDSDFYAVVWDADLNLVTKVEYASTRYHSTGNASVDATPEVRAAAAAWCQKAALARLIAEDHKKASTPIIDRAVRVVGGRKYKGKEGIVFYRQEQRSAHGTWSYGYRLGIRTSDEKDSRGFWKDSFFIDEKHVEVVNPVQYETPISELRERTARLTESVAPVLLNPAHVITL